jgi:hypothetical protein
MLTARPGNMILIGNGDTAACHHPAFDFNEAALPHGVLIGFVSSRALPTSVAVGTLITNAGRFRGLTAPPRKSHSAQHAQGLSSRRRCVASLDLLDGLGRLAEARRVRCFHGGVEQRALHSDHRCSPSQSRSYHSRNPIDLHVPKSPDGSPQRSERGRVPEPAVSSCNKHRPQSGLTRSPRGHRARSAAGTARPRVFAVLGRPREP